jgi:hypothetical protein
MNMGALLGTVIVSVLLVSALGKKNGIASAVHLTIREMLDTIACSSFLYI